MKNINEVGQSRVYWHKNLVKCDFKFVNMNILLVLTTSVPKNLIQFTILVRL